MMIFEKGSGNSEQLVTTGWNILAEEVSLPIAVLSDKAIANNAQWMQTFSEKSQVQLAPHGKTTMAPELFKLQLAQGCWGITLATMPQVVNAYHQGIKRIILANQLVGRFHALQLVELLRDTNFEFYCFVDSIENARWLGEFFNEYALENISVNVLLEIGVNGGRCGWRDLDNIAPLVATLKAYSQLNIAGISFYEGVIHGDQAYEKICEFIEGIKRLFSQLTDQNAFSDRKPIITGAGSAWYDVVAKQLTLPLNSNSTEQKSKGNELDFIPVIRPGCYLIHDTGIYQDAQQNVMARSQLACDLAGDLSSSLTVWAYVYSVPEPGLVIIGLGKRDCAFDAGLPTPELFYRPKQLEPSQTKPSKAPSHWQVVKIMDQHCMMKVGESDDIKPGDIISFSTSHPCLTIDKWRKIGIVDEAFNVTKQIATYF